MAFFDPGEIMTKNIIVDAAEEVACPKCSHTFALSEGISRQSIERHAEDFERQLAERGKALKEALSAEARRSAERAAAAAKEQFDTELKAAREALAAKEGALARFRSEELDLRRKLREAEDARKNQELDYQRKLDAERKQIQDSARTAAADEFAREKAQLRAQIDSAQREAADLKRKLEQGSQQTQGEALELGLEAMLRSAFPMDEVLPVPKGVTGADLLQRVRSPSGQLCGTIVWETKQTKSWSAAWLAKLKDDQQAVGAELAVLVTSAMPKDVREPFVREADVWIARFEAARPLAEALRQSLLELHKVRVANAGRSEKMALVYSYICSPQFAQRVRSIVEGFDAMRRDLEAEKAAYTRMWAKREKQLQRMTSGMLNVVGDLQGIGEEGLPQLESIAVLPEPEEID
jgi:hypothetical protein